MRLASLARIAVRAFAAAFVWAAGFASSVAEAAVDSAEPPVKLSTSGICHERGARFYPKTTNYTPFGTLDECLRAGGRLPRGVTPLSAPGNPPASPAELVALSDAWIAAEVNQDRAALERLLDERFRATLASGKTVDRTAFIERILKSKVEPFEVSNDVIEIHGETALVIATLLGSTTKFTWVAVRKDGRWRVISETFSKMAAREG